MPGLVHMPSLAGEGPRIPFEVRVDGAPPGLSHGAVRERTLEVTFVGPGASLYVVTFG
jgi:hypothetical protein